MILQRGFTAPTALQKRLLRDVADDSFTRTLGPDFGDVPFPSSYEIQRETLTALKLKHVEPHSDEWVGHGRVPKRYAAIFWLVDLPKFHDVIVQVGTQGQRMRAGDWIAFDDRILHCVHSKRIWRGCAYQARFLKTA